MFKKNSNIGNGSKYKNYFSIFVKAVAYGTLLAAFIYGFMISGIDYKSKLEEVYPGAEFEQISNDPLVFKATENDSLEFYYTYSAAKGYGGELEVFVKINVFEESVKDVITISHKETPSFFNKINNEGFFRQFHAKPVDNRFVIDENINAISGATVSSKAFNQAIQKGTAFTGNNYFGKNIIIPESGIRFGWQELILITLVFSSVLLTYYKNQKWRNFLLGVSVFYLGFYLNASLSIAKFGDLLMGNLPSYSNNPFLLILLLAVIIGAIIVGKNFYCGSICPFYGIEKGLSKLSGIKFTLPNKLSKIVKNAAGFYLWLALLLIFITANPSMGSFEPFAMVFSLDGEGIQWFLLPAILVGTFFMPNFFCKYFCPVGSFLTRLIRVRKNIINVRMK